MKKIEKIFHYLIIAIFVVFPLYILVRNFPLSGTISQSANFSENSPFIFDIGPDPRVIKGPDALVILEGPIYFDTRVMPFFNEVRISITYQQRGLKLEGLGRQTGQGFSYEVLKPALLSEENGWITAEWDIRSDNFYTERNVTRVLLDIMDEAGIFSERKHLILKSMTITQKK